MLGSQERVVRAMFEATFQVGDGTQALFTGSTAPPSSAGRG
jgi:hypothetical protein